MNDDAAINRNDCKRDSIGQRASAPTAGRLDTRPPVPLKFLVAGAAAAGSTAVCQRLVSGTFTDADQSTVGVRTDRKEVNLADGSARLTLWDLPADISSFDRRFLMHAANGIVLVVDGTDRRTLDRALELHAELGPLAEQVAFLLLVNKADHSEQEITTSDLQDFEDRGFLTASCSARTGQGIDDAFEGLVQHWFSTTGEASTNSTAMPHGATK